MRRALVIAGILATSLCGCRSADKGQGKAELIADVESIQPGIPFMAGVLITLPKHWHTYWLNPGDSGMAPELKWQLPDGFTAGPVLWPAPKRFDEPPVASFGYDNQVLLLREIRPPADLAVGRDYTMEVSAAWLICREACVPKSARLQLTLPARADPPAASAEWHPLFARTKGEVPAPDPAWTFRAFAGDETISLCVTPPPGAESTLIARSSFFPAQTDLVEYGPETWTRSKDEYCLGMKRISGGESLPGRLQGILVLPRGKGAIEVDIALQPTKKGSS